MTLFAYCHGQTIPPSFKHPLRANYLLRIEYQHSFSTLYGSRYIDRIADFFYDGNIHPIVGILFKSDTKLIGEVMARNPVAACWEDSDWLYLRFEGVDKSHFAFILYAFKKRIPTATWMSTLEAWRIPKNDLQAVAVFANELFGQRSLQLRGSVPPRQLELPLNS